MKTKLTKILSVLMAVILSFSACKKEKQIIDDDSDAAPYETGVFVINEGPFQTGSGTVTFYDRSTKTVKQDIFETENSRPLGNVVQSITIYNDKAYIVVNNGSKVEVVDVKTFKSVGVIDSITLPRFFAAINSSKAYISDWTGKISVVNLSNYAVSSSINVGGSPDKMIVTNGNAYVIGSAGFTSDSTLHIIDVANDTKLNTLVIGDNPSDMVLDVNGKIWIVCGGISDWVNPGNNTNATLVKFNPSTNLVEQTYDLGSTNFGAKITINAAKTKVYYTLANGIYEFDINNPVVNVQPIIAKSFYNIGFDNASGYIYGADPKDYSSNGWVYRYNTSNGTPVDSFQVGVIPTGFAFN